MRQIFFSIENAISVLLFWNSDKLKIEKIELLPFYEQPDKIDCDISDPLLYIYHSLKDFFKNGGIDSNIFKYIDLSCYSDYAKCVYLATSNITFGKIAYYSDIARNVGYLNSARGIGKVLSVNRYPLIIPCHRIIRKPCSARFGWLGGDFWRVVKPCSARFGWSGGDLCWVVKHCLGGFSYGTTLKEKLLTLEKTFLKGVPHKIKDFMGL